MLVCLAACSQCVCPSEEMQEHQQHPIHDRKDVINVLAVTLDRDATHHARYRRDQHGPKHVCIKHERLKLSCCGMAAAGWLLVFTHRGAHICQAPSCS